MSSNVNKKKKENIQCDKKVGQQQKKKNNNRRRRRPKKRISNRSNIQSIDGNIYEGVKTQLMGLVGCKPNPMPRPLPIPVKTFCPKGTTTKEGQISTDYDIVGEYIPGNNYGPIIWDTAQPAAPTFVTSSFFRAITVSDLDYVSVRDNPVDQVYAMTPVAQNNGRDIVRRWLRSPGCTNFRQDNLGVGFQKDTLPYYNINTTGVSSTKVLTFSMAYDAVEAPSNIEIHKFDDYYCKGTETVTTAAWTVATTGTSASINALSIELVGQKSFYIIQKLTSVAGKKLEHLTNLSVLHSSAAIVGTVDFEDYLPDVIPLFGTNVSTSFQSDLSAANGASVTGAWLRLVQRSGEFTNSTLMAAVVPSSYMPPLDVSTCQSDLSSLQFNWTTRSGTDGIWLPWIPYDVNDYVMKQEDILHRGFTPSSKIVFLCNSGNYQNSKYILEIEHAQRIELLTMNQAIGVLKPSASPTFLMHLFGLMHMYSDLLIGENPNHMQRIKNFVNKALSDPEFKRVATLALKGVASAGLASLAAI